MSEWFELLNIKKIPVKDKYHYDIAYVQNLKNMIQMNLFIKQKQTHRHREQTYGYQRGKMGRGIN